jgi:hypothetical protein
MSRYDALEKYLTGLEEQLLQLQQIAQRISERRVKMYVLNILLHFNFVTSCACTILSRTSAPSFPRSAAMTPGEFSWPLCSSLKDLPFLHIIFGTIHPIIVTPSFSNGSLGSALVAISQKCDAITSMYKSQASTDETRLAVPLQMYAPIDFVLFIFSNTLACTNAFAPQPETLYDAGSPLSNCCAKPPLNSMATIASCTRLKSLTQTLPSGPFSRG